MNINKVKIVLIIVIVFLVLGIGALAIFKFPVKSLLPAPNYNRPSETTYIDDIKTMGKAIAEKNVAACDQLKEIKKDDCLYAIADNNNDATFCQQITDATLKNKCADLIDSHLYINSQDVKKCLVLTNVEVRTDCLLSIFKQQFDLKYCIDFINEDKILCEDMVYTNLALQAKDKNLCLKVKNENYRLNCTSAIAATPADSDTDGLTDGEERAYGTNPFAADTDGDGVNDLQELQIGHNPLIAD